MPVVCIQCIPVLSGKVRTNSAKTCVMPRTWGPAFTVQQWQCKPQNNSVLLNLDNVHYLNAEFK